MRERIVFLCVGGLALAAAPAGAIERGNATDVTSIQRLQSDFANAWNRDDASGMAAAFTDDADLINPMGERAQGRSQITALFTREHAGPLRATTFATRCESPRFFSPTVATVTCPFTIDKIHAAIGPTSQEGTLTQVLTKQGGKWRVSVARPMFPAPPLSAAALPPRPRAPAGMPSTEP